MCQVPFPGSDKFKVLCLGRSLIYLSPSKTVTQNREDCQQLSKPASITALDLKHTQGST